MPPVPFLGASVTVEDNTFTSTACAHCISLWAQAEVSSSTTPILFAYPARYFLDAIRADQITIIDLRRLILRLNVTLHMFSLYQSPLAVMCPVCANLCKRAALRPGSYAKLLPIGRSQPIAQAHALLPLKVGSQSWLSIDRTTQIERCRFDQRTRLC